MILFTTYKGLFSFETIDTKGMSAEELGLYKQERENEAKHGFSRWGAFGWIEKLSNGDITKFDDVCKQNFILCMELLSYWKERDEFVKREQERNRKEIK